MPLPLCMPPHCASSCHIPASMLNLDSRPRLLNTPRPCLNFQVWAHSSEPLTVTRIPNASNPEPFESYEVAREVQHRKIESSVVLIVLSAVFVGFEKSYPFVFCSCSLARPVERRLGSVWSQETADARSCCLIVVMIMNVASHLVCR